jgi:large subunit ribosomal protein L24
MKKKSKTAITAKKRRLRAGDKVKVIAGNDRGLTGQVLQIVGNRVLVQGVNVRKKAVKKTQEQPQGGFIDIERTIHRSNVAICDDEGNVLKLKVRDSSEGERELVYTQGGETKVYRSIKRAKIKS